MRTFYRVLTVAALLAAACGGEEPPVEPKLSDIQRRIFNVSCTFSSCHSLQERKGNMTLVSGQARTNLVDVDPDNEPARNRGKKRVVPGDPSKSFLYHKLMQTPDLLAIDEGDPMPQVGTRLPQQKIDAIRMWIERGALDD